jgi:hypothetical protein
LTLSEGQVRGDQGGDQTRGELSTGHIRDQSGGQTREELSTGQIRAEVRPEENRVQVRSERRSDQRRIENRLDKRRPERRADQRGIDDRSEIRSGNRSEANGAELRAEETNSAKNQEMTASQVASAGRRYFRVIVIVIVNDLSNKQLRLIRNPIIFCRVTRIRDKVVSYVVGLGRIIGITIASSIIPPHDGLTADYEILHTGN